MVEKSDQEFSPCHSRAGHVQFTCYVAGGNPCLDEGSVSEEESSKSLDEGTKIEALKIARQTLESFIIEKKKPDFFPKSQYLYQHLGAFVTLRINGQLRGCTGLFEPEIPLWQVIRDQTIISAAKDSRFNPVTKDELDKIKIEISVMTPKCEIDDWQEIEMGKHGVVLLKGNHGGTFLPQVATETGWGREDFLSQLCTQKAGLPKEGYKDPDTELYVFEAMVFEEE